MKVVLNTGYILLFAGLIGGIAHAKGLVKIEPASNVECTSRDVELASDDFQQDHKKAKVLTVRDRTRVLASVMSTNSERIAYLASECEDATKSARRVAVNVLTGEVTPKGGFKTQSVTKPQVAAPAMNLSLHVIPRKAKSPNDL